MPKSPEQNIKELAGRLAGELGLELVEVSLRGQGRRTLLRIALDSEAGVTLNDCQLFSRRLEGLMDVEDPIAGPYTMEVSSPGLDRPLKTPNDFKKHVGKLLRVVTKEKIEDQSFFLGRLKEVREGSITLTLSRKKGASVDIEIPFDNIAKAQMEIEVK